MNEIIENLTKILMLRVDDMVLSVKKILTCEELKEKDSYLFKGDIIVTNSDSNKKELIKDNEGIIEKLKKNSLSKLDSLGIKGDISFEIIRKTKVFSKYKENIHHNSYKSLIKVFGDYEAVKAIYEVGFGENTSTGHGLMWEA